MKSQLDMLLSIAGRVLADSIQACAYQRVDLERDISRLHTWSSTRGLALFTLDLPSLDNHLTRALALGRLSTSGPLARRRSKKDCRPRFLWGLWSLVFDHTGCLKEDACPTSVFYLRQVFCLGKKIEVACSPDRLKAAVEEYHAIEQEIVGPQLRWDLDDLGVPSSDLSFSRSFDTARLDWTFFGNSEVGLPLHKELQEALSRLDFVSLVLASKLGVFNAIGGEDCQPGSFRHGPGAVSDGKEACFKYAFPNWPEKLDSVFNYDWCGSHTIVPDTFPSVHEPPSKLVAVPKTAKAPRLIASEPTAHQWCQQRLATWLTWQYDHSTIGMFVSLRDQTASQKLVRSASIVGDLATLDLSSASDRLSCRHVESLFRGNRSVLEACHAVRTRWVVDRLSSPTRFLKIKKFAAQGSALTFPVQTLFFLACCLAACGAKTWSDILDLQGKVRVYGDDLIVPVEAYARLVALLSHLGLKVNEHKSFSSGRFRESCGMDCWRGYDVTPVKPKTLVADTPEQYQSLVDTTNNLWKKGCWKASKELESTLQAEGILLPVVGADSGVPALVSFVGPSVEGLATRWHEGLHKTQVRMHKLKKPVQRKRQDVSAALLQYFTEEPDPGLPWASGVARSRTAKFAAGWEDLELIIDPALYRVGLENA